MAYCSNSFPHINVRCRVRLSIFNFFNHYYHFLKNHSILISNKNALQNQFNKSASCFEKVLKQETKWEIPQRSAG